MRKIALDSETVAVLLTHRHQVERDAAALGYTITDDSFMFAATPDGATPMKPPSISQRYARWAKRLDIKSSLKALRHYSATELIVGGVDVRTVAGRLGHSGGGTTTLKIYTAWVSEADQHAAMSLMTTMPSRPAALLRPTRDTRGQDRPVPRHRRRPHPPHRPRRIPDRHPDPHGQGTRLGVPGRRRHRSPRGHGADRSGPAVSLAWQTSHSHRIARRNATT